MRHIGVCLFACLIACAFGAAAIAQTYTPLSCSQSQPITETVSYTVPGTSVTRSVTIKIVEPTALPAGVTLPLPTVIWSHGGAGGNNANTLADWRGVTAEACYTSVSIGHTWPQPVVEDAICTDLLDLTSGVDCGEGYQKLLSLLRPWDIVQTIDYLENNYADLVDITKIAVGGHSAGAGGTLMVAGATRAFRTGDRSKQYIDIRDLSDPRPVAFLAFSPQGPGVDGFYETWKRSGETSWDTVERPVLIATGDGDNGCDQTPRTTTSSTIHYCANLGPTPSNRKAVFDLIPADPAGEISKYLLYIDHWRAAHTIFKYSRNTCVSGGGGTRDDICDQMLEVLSRTAIGFLDWHVRGDPLAEDFLAQDPNTPRSRGKFLWDSK